MPNSCKGWARAEDCQNIHTTVVLPAPRLPHSDQPTCLWRLSANCALVFVVSMRRHVILYNSNQLPHVVLHYQVDCYGLKGTHQPNAGTLNTMSILPSMARSSSTADAQPGWCVMAGVNRGAVAQLIQVWFKVISGIRSCCRKVGIHLSWPDLGCLEPGPFHVRNIAMLHVVNTWYVNTRELVDDYPLSVAPCSAHVARVGDGRGVPRHWV